MSLWHIAWSYLWNRKLTTSLTIASVGLGVGLISAVLTLREETEKRFAEEGQAFDIVIGAKGNPLQLVLSTVYFFDAPVGNIDADIMDQLREADQEEDRIAALFPVGMGDSYRGYRIVGVTRDLMDFDWGDRKPYELAEGRQFEAPFEAVIGANIAQDTGLRIGDTFVGMHGFVESSYAEVHEDHPYTVVGILQRSGSPNDRAIFCDIRSVWEAHCPGETCELDHEHKHEDVTAVLVKLTSPAFRFEFKDEVNRNFNAMAAIPVMEVMRLYEHLLGTANLVLLAIGYLVVGISALSILIGLYMAILQRKRDLAIMRALGATRGEIFGAVIIEAFWVTVMGIAAGWFMGTAVCAALSRILVARIGFHVPPISLNADLVSAYSAVILMGLVAGILPAWQAYRANVARDLAEL